MKKNENGNLENGHKEEFENDKAQQQNKMSYSEVAELAHEVLANVPVDGDEK